MNLKGNKADIDTEGDTTNDGVDTEGKQANPAESQSRSPQALLDNTETEVRPGVVGPAASGVYEDPTTMDPAELNEFLSGTSPEDLERHTGLIEEAMKPRERLHPAGPAEGQPVHTPVHDAKHGVAEKPADSEGDKGKSSDASGKAAKS